MISCLIWPSINSWRHHNGLRTQNFNLHIMTLSYFWKIDCISVNIDQFSSKFWYVLAETYSLQMQYPRIFILTKTSWRIFAIKGGMSIFHILRVFSMGHDFFSKLDSTFPSFTSNISVVLASFSLSIEYVVAETISYHKCDIYFSIICRDHAHISDHLNRPRDDLNSSYYRDHHRFNWNVYITTHLLKFFRIIKTWHLFLHFISFIRWSVDDRSPIDFVRIFFILYFFISLFIFISSVHFFDHTFTRNRHGQFPLNLCQSSSPMISSLIYFFKVIRSSWRHPGAIL